MPARIVVDEREKSSGIPDLLRKAGAVIDFAQLKVGDYVVSPEIAVERKTVHDLLSSIYDGRLFLQCSDLVKHYQKPLIVVQGNLAELAEIPEGAEDKDINKLAERMPLTYDALATVVTEFRIPIIHTPSADQTVQFLVTLVNKSLREGKATGPLLRKIKKENPIKIQQLSVLSSVGCLKNSTHPIGLSMLLWPSLLLCQALGLLGQCGSVKSLTLAIMPRR